LNALARSFPRDQLGELLPHIDLKVLDQRPGQRLPNLNAFLGTPAIDGALDLEQRIDPPHDLDRNGRERDLLLAGGLATRMDPTRRFPDRSRVASRQIELVVPVIGVGLQDAGISGQMRLGCSPLRSRSFWVSGKLSSVPCKPPVPLFRLYLFASVKNAFMSLTKAQATDWRAHCFRSFRA